MNCANALGSMTVYDLLKSDGNSATNITKCGRETTGTEFLRTEHPHAKVSEALTVVLKENFTSLKQLVDIDADMTERGKEVKIVHSDKLYITERKLLILANSWGPGKFATSACIAATIDLDNHLRGVGFNTRLIARLVTRLQLSITMVLNDVSRHDANEKTVKAILWVLFIGGIAAEARPETEWFDRQLPKYCDMLSLGIREKGGAGTEGLPLGSDLAEARPSIMDESRRDAAVGTCHKAYCR